MARSKDTIFITYVDQYRNLLKIWGQRDRICANFIENQLRNSWAELSRAPPPPPTVIQKGMICFAKCSNEKFYRAKVVSEVYRDSVTVFFIDYGHTDKVDLSSIRVLNRPGDGDIPPIVPQVDEFYLSEIGTRGGYPDEVMNEIRFDLCYREFEYRLTYQYQNFKFINIYYKDENYVNMLLRRNIGVSIGIPDMCITLGIAKRVDKPVNQNKAQASMASAVQPHHMMPKLHPKQLLQPSHIPVNSFPDQTGFPNNMNQNAAFNRDNNNVVQSEIKVTPVLNSVMIEALADKLKQHLFKEPVDPSPETKSLNYVTQVLEVGTTHNVYVSYIDDGPWSFSVQLVSSEHELNQLMDELAACDLVPIKLPLVLGHPCIAKSREYDNYCRGVVVNISHSAVKIFFVDFGNTEDLPVSSLFELPMKFFKVKAMSQRFALSGLQKIKPSPEIKKAFVEVVENELLLLQVATLEGENLPTCDLFLKNVNIKRILNDKVLQTRKWTPIQPPQQGEVEKVVVTWIDSPQKFYVQLKRNDRELENLRNELAHWGATGEFINPDELVPGALCVCCFTGDNEWYRAIVTSINSKNSVTVFYVDYGNTEVVRPIAIKKIGNGLIRQLNTQAIQCCLHGFENRPIDPGMRTVLEGLILEKELSLKVIYTDKNHIVVKLFDKDNDISLSLSNSVTQAPHPKNAAKNPKNETIKNTGEKTDSGNRKNDVKNRPPPQDKSWRKKEEKNPRSDTSSEGGWRSDDSRKDMRGKDGKAVRRSKKFDFRSIKEEAGRDEKNWRIRENVDMKNINEKKGQARSKPAESIMERAKRVARETQQKVLQMPEMSMTRYPVKLENMALHGASFKGKHIPVGSVEEVIVTYFLNPNEIHVQLLSTKEKFRSVMDEIQNYYSTKLPVANFPKKGDVVIAKFKGDEVLYRASVIDTSPLTVRYADYGNEEVTERERLWPMDKKFLELEAQAIKCSLPNLLPNGADTWPVPEAQIDKIFEFETYSCKFLNCTENLYEVCLTISENGKDVRDELVAAGFALPAENKKGLAAGEGVKQCPSMDLTLLRTESYRVYVSHVADPSEVYVQLEPDVVVVIEEKANKIVDAQKSIPQSDIINGGLYLANIGDNWRRVKVIKKMENVVVVHLIDYGDKMEVAYEQIKPIDDDILQYPSQAVQCCLYTETEEYPVGIAEGLKGCVKNNFIAYVHDVLENRLRVTLYDTEGDKLEFLRDLNDEPSVIRLVTSLPISRQGVAVTLSHITSPKEIYIQRMSDLPELEELNTALYEFYSSGGEELETGGKICAAKSVADEGWYRARVMKLMDDHAKVLYIDFGNTEEVPLSNIKKLDPKLRETHAFCRRISLNVDYDEGDEAEHTAKLMEMISDKECVGYFAKVDDVMYAELVVDDCAVSDRLLSDKVKRVRDGMFRDVSSGKKVEEESATEKDTGVFISHVSCPSEFWVHPESISNELEAFQNMLQSVCSRAPPKKNIQVGDVVGTLFTDQLWYRSKVVSIEDNTLLIQFIDYGNSLKKESSDSEIVELTEEVIKVPPFARFCSLKGHWKDTAAVRFEEIITVNQDPFILIELQDENPKIVDLVQNGVSVTEQLMSEGYHSLSEDLEDDDVYITHINSPNDFYIQRNSHKSLFDMLISELLEADMFEDVEEVKENEIYCAKFPENEMWYRAKVLKQNTDGAYVHFIDYGNNCSVMELKHLPQEFLSIPVLSLNCCLLYGESNDTWSEAACKKFTEYVNDSAFKMEIIFTGAQRSVVKLLTEDGQNVTDILEKLCESDNREFVWITHINSPSDFYVQRTNDTDFDVIDERMKDGDTFADLSEKDVGMLCAAEYEDGKWYRARLKNTSDVFFIDYGNTFMATRFKSLPDDIKEIPPLAKNCCLDFRVTNIPESIKEEFKQLTEQNPLLRIKVIQPGERDRVSLMLNGMKLEEVLLYTISETSEIYNIQVNDENQSDKKTEESNMEDDVRAGNETDEEKRVKFAIITSENTEGFRSDDEKGIIEGYVNSSGLNVPDNELLEEATGGEETVEEPDGETEFNDQCDEDGSTNTSKYYEGVPGETGGEVNSPPQQEGVQKVSFDDKLVSAVVNGTTEDGTN